jgi:hypothetical protein
MSGTLDNSVRDPMNIAVKFGRRWTLFIVSPNLYLIYRVCPGRHLAHSTITLAVASVLSIFDLLRKVDENGREIEPKKKYKSGGIR